MFKPKALVEAIKIRCPDYDLSEGVFIKAAEITQRPRLLKCHLALPLLSPDMLDTAKV